MALGASITTFVGMSTKPRNKPQIGESNSLLTNLKNIVEITSGLGRHMETLTADQLHRFNACRFAATILYVVGLTSTKLSFLAQYYRTFADRNIRRICMCFGFYCCLWLIVQCILYSFSCIPIQYLFPNMTEMCILSPGICKFLLMESEGNKIADTVLQGRL